MQELLIFIPRRTNRLVYIINHFCREQLGLETKYCTNEEEFKAYDKPKIHYGHYALGDEFFIAADSLLFERGIQDNDIEMGEYEGLPSLFQTYSRQSQYPFDLFAASFYLLSRYEEYLPFIKDQYGRFDASVSMAYQYGFLQKPLVDIWAMDLHKKLKTHFPELIFKTPEYQFIPSIDVDAAFAYKHKGTLRTLGGYLKNLRDLDFADLKLRTQVLLGKKQDPFNTFEYLFKLHKKHKLKALFFILFADYGTNDKNTPTYNRRFRSLIAYIGDHSDVGIHPSYTSNSVSGKLKKEIMRLSQCIHRDIHKSRQHFLVVQMPTTYRNLINLGITDDYSMGYASEIGFRASTSRSFLLYDLEMEYTTSLRIHPFTAMEGTLCDYQKKNTAEALEALKSIIDEVRAVNGTYISLWHNESVSDKKRWKGWKAVYEEMIEYALP